jgi:hypothetical protein
LRDETETRFAGFAFKRTDLAGLEARDAALPDLAFCFVFFAIGSTRLKLYRMRHL